jgi:hypothetical protein
MITEADRKGIVKEIRDWSKYALETSSPDFNNLPPCPYAKAAWQENKVDILFKTDEEDYKALYKALTEWDDSKELVIIADTEFEEDPDKFHYFVDSLNEVISDQAFGDQDFWVMGFHPEDESNELIDDGTFEGEIETQYAMFFVQRLSKLEKAAEKLRPLGYYEKYFEEYDVAEMYELRTNFYRQLINGNVGHGNI